MSDRFSDILKNATEINLRYSASLLNLSKDYIKAFSGAITQKEASDGDDSGDQDDDQAKTKTETKTETKRIPLIVAGRKGEKTNAAFAVNNTSQMEGTVTLRAVGEFADSNIKIEPETLSLKNGEGAIIRILATIGKKLSVEEDYRGTVVIPELGLQVAEFVVRRLPDLPSKKKTARRASKKKTIK